jgi:hypothetical protein
MVIKISTLAAAFIFFITAALFSISNVEPFTGLATPTHAQGAACQMVYDGWKAAGGPFGTTPSDPIYDPRFEFTGDSFIDIKDYGVWRCNNSDEVWCSAVLSGSKAGTPQTCPQPPIMNSWFASCSNTSPYASFSWTPIGGAAAYNIYRNNVFLTTTYDSNYSDFAVTTNNQYYYEVTTVSIYGPESVSRSNPTAWLTIPNCSPPSPPTNVVVTAYCSGNSSYLFVSWSSVPGADSYYLIRTDGGINGNVGNTTAFSDGTPAANNSIVGYWVYAHNANGYSTPTFAQTTTPNCTSPTGALLTATCSSPTTAQLHLTWTLNPYPIDNYAVWLPAISVSYAGYTNSWNSVNVALNTTYTTYLYSHSAINGPDQSGWLGPGWSPNTPASVTTPANCSPPGPVSITGSGGCKTTSDLALPANAFTFSSTNAASISFRLRRTVSSGQMLATGPYHTLNASNVTYNFTNADFNYPIGVSGINARYEILATATNSSGTALELPSNFNIDYQSSCARPFLQTVGGDVHSDQNIQAP